jgi:hypothetical protein
MLTVAAVSTLGAKRVSDPESGEYFQVRQLAITRRTLPIVSKNSLTNNHYYISLVVISLCIQKARNGLY